MKQLIILAQNILKQLNCYSGALDGHAGPATMAALSTLKGSGGGTVSPAVILAKPWSNERKIIAFVQSYANRLNIDAGTVDGLVGPQTLFAAEQVEILDRTGDLPDPWRDDLKAVDSITKKIVEVNPNGWPKMDTRSMTDFYGPVGQDQVALELPYAMRLAWDIDTTVNKITCHEKVHDSLGRVLAAVLKEYGEGDIRKLGLDLFGGCLNVRLQRGGSKPSIHSWGAALDIDPMRNQLKWGRNKATLDNPPYDPWWKLWEAEGWVSLGRRKNYDWQHVQAAKL